MVAYQAGANNRAWTLFQWASATTFHFSERPADCRRSNRFRSSAEKRFCGDEHFAHEKREERALPHRFRQYSKKGSHHHTPFRAVVLKHVVDVGYRQPLHVWHQFNDAKARVFENATDCPLGE